MKKLIIFFIFCSNFVVSQESLHNEELIFTNLSSSTVFIEVYPISMVFNGDNEYNLVAKKRGGNFNEADYIAAVYYQATNVFQEISLIPTESKGLEFDFDNGGVGNIYGIYGYGKYKIKLTYAFLDSIILDIDVNASGDLLINFYNDSISYQFSEGNYPIISLSTSNFTIQTWKKFGPTQNSQKNLGNFKYALGTIANPNDYNIIPLDCRIDCNVLNDVPNQNRDRYTLFDNRNGILSLNLEIEKDIYTNAGTYDTEFNGADLSSGVYYYKMESVNFSEIKKMILIKCVVLLKY